MRVEKLHGQEQWTIWKFQIKHVLESMDVLEVANGTKKIPDNITDAEYASQKASWLKLDAKAKRVISTSVGKVPMLHILNCTTSNEMWTSLHKVYEPTSTAVTLLLHNKYASFTKDPADDMAIFLAKLLDIVYQLREKNEQLSDRMVMAKILMSLPPEYNHFSSSWDSADAEKQSIEAMKSRLMIEESRLIQQGRIKNSDALTVSNRQPKKAKDKKKKKKDKSGGCFDCGATDHWKRDCPRQKSAPDASNKQGDALVCETKSVSYDENAWILDTGASEHMCNRRDWFNDFVEDKSTVTIGDGRMIMATGRGHINVMAFDGTKWNTKHIDDVVYVPDIHMNLFSSGRSMDRGHKSRSDKERCELIKDGRIVAVGVRRKTLFQMLFKVIQPAEKLAMSSVASKKLNVRVWHEKLGHQNLQHVRKFLRDNNIDFVDEEYICEACMYGKQHRQPFDSRTERATKCGEIVHSDVCILPEESFGGARYYVLFRDDHSRYRIAYFLKQKSEVFEKFKAFVAMAKNDGQVIKCLRTDNGLEFVNRDMVLFMEQNGIRHQKTVPYTPEQNGCSERDNRTLVEAARTMIVSRDLNKRFWAEAVNTAVYVLNRTGKSTVDGQSPYELWHGKKSRLDNFHVFGTDVFVHIPAEKRNKLDAKSAKCVFVGYDENVKGFRVYNPDSGKIQVARDVVFLLEDHVVHKFEEKGNSAENDESEEVRDEGMSDDPNDTLLTEDGDEINNSLMTDDETPTKKNGSWCGVDQRNVINNRLRGGSTQNSSAFAEHMAMIAMSDEPATYEEAIRGNNRAHWVNAMANEYDSLMKNRTWILVESPCDQKVIDNRWVYKIKQNTDGSIERYKARLVVRGFSQQHGIDYLETFSPVVKFTSIRTILALAAARKMKLKQFDVKTAFLYGDLQESVFMKQPVGYDNGSGRVCKLLKSLYGLKQSSRCWNKRFTDFITKFDFKPCSADPCVFVREKFKKMTVLAIYIDDGLIASDDENDIAAVISFLCKEFEMKSFNVECFLGLQIAYRPDGSIHIHQEAYAEKVLKRFNMMECNPVKTPTDASQNLGDFTVEETVQFPYREAVGSLMYLAIGTRPDISFAVGNVSRYMEKPNNAHVEAVKRVLKYIKRTMNTDILYKKDVNLEFSAYSDADYAGDVLTRKSTSGYAFMLGNGIVSWASQRQKSVATSTTEAEYIAASEAVKELVWLERFLNELLGKSMKAVLYIDNQSAIRLIKNPEFHKRTKHIDVRYHFIREKFEDGFFDLVYIASDEQKADVLTKPLVNAKHQYNCKLLGLQPSL